MTNYNNNNNDGIAFTYTFTDYSEDGSFDTVTVAKNKSSVSGVVVCFDAATASYRISDPIVIPRAAVYADTIFVDTVCSFVGSHYIEHDAWYALERLEMEYQNAYDC